MRKPEKVNIPIQFYPDVVYSYAHLSVKTEEKNVNKSGLTVYIPKKQNNLQMQKVWS